MRLARMLLGVSIVVSSLVGAVMKSSAVSIARLPLSDSIFEKKEGGVSFAIKGSGISWYQYAGHNSWKTHGKPNSNWTFFENKHKVRYQISRKKKRGVGIGSKVSPIDFGHTVGNGADGWNRMFDDIKLMKEQGLNSWRFDLPWADLNPVQGEWNEEAFKLFDRYIDALLENDIKPMITLYHWVHPMWFSRLGGWEKEENIEHFVRFAQEAFKRFGHKVQLWCTMNEPTVISACGYVLGTHAPAGQAQYAGPVLWHLLKAHCETYKALKLMPHGQESKIGIVHQMLRFQQKRFQVGAASFMNFIFGHDTVFNFFKTGDFEYVPTWSNMLGAVRWVVPVRPFAMKPIRKTYADAPYCNDYIGLNFYSRVILKPQPAPAKGRPMTDMDYCTWPEALYEALHEMNQLGKPIYITENGIPDAKDDRREKWIIGYANAAYKALQEGVNLIGFYYWSLVDNFEWNMGHTKKFGLYEVNTLSQDPAKKGRRLRKGGEAYRDYVHVALPVCEDPQKRAQSAFAPPKARRWAQKAE